MRLYVAGLLALLAVSLAACTRFEPIPTPTPTVTPTPMATPTPKATPTPTVQPARNWQVFPTLPPNHLPEGTTYGAYNTVPPTSGPHWPQAAPWGFYTEPVPNERQLHNLEHGGVMVQYNTTDQQLISQLEQFARKQADFPCYLIVAPYPNMPYTIAVTAWGVRDTMDSYDEGRLQSFVNVYRNQGPERVSCTP